MSRVLLFSLFLLVTAKTANGNFLCKYNQKVVDIIMEDVFPVPQATRIHAYTNIAAYEALANSGSKIKSLANRANGLTAVPKPAEKIIQEVAASTAFLLVAKKLLYSEYLIDSFYAGEKKLWQTKFVDDQLIAASINYGTIVANHIADWIKKDNYDYTRTLLRYEVKKGKKDWQPTAPEYMNALEPNWPLMRSICNTKSISALPDINYSENPNSKYYKNAVALLNQAKRLDSSQIMTAWYWDDNPKTAVSSGHLTYFIHKATPAGHWIKISCQALKQRNVSMDSSAQILMLTSIAMYEAILGCWTTKYKYNAVRPETYLHRALDKNFKPLIETPPFPEYSSGHSTISSAAATILSATIGKNIPFTDSSQLYLNFEPRNFSSFMAAAEQASISRFYGGIHYMPALQNGMKHGKKLAENVLLKMYN